jgi:hypothetical protein
VANAVCLLPHTHTRTHIHIYTLTHSLCFTQLPPLDIFMVFGPTSAPRKHSHAGRRVCDTEHPFYPTWLQIFFSFFKTLVGKQVIVELKNDLACVTIPLTSATSLPPPLLGTGIGGGCWGWCGVVWWHCSAWWRACLHLAFPRPPLSQPHTALQCSWHNGHCPVHCQPASILILIFECFARDGDNPLNSGLDACWKGTSRCSRTYRLYASISIWLPCVASGLDQRTDAAGLKVRCNRWTSTSTLSCRTSRSLIQRSTLTW